MRTFYLSVLVVLSLGSLALPGCDKEDPITQTAPTPTPPPQPPTPIPPPPANTAPVAVAGADTWVPLPADSVVLTGASWDAENNVDKYEWRQISGPVKGDAIYPGLKRMRVLNLQKGTYTFELTVTDKGGLATKDTVAVFIVDPDTLGQKQVVYKDFGWQCPMGCWVDLGCLSCNVSANQPFKVFLRKDNTNQWEEVVPEEKWVSTTKYYYAVYNNNLTVFTYYEEEMYETPDFMIAY